MCQDSCDPTPEPSVTATVTATVTVTVTVTVTATATATVTVTVTVTDNLFRHEFQKKPRPSPLSARDPVLELQLHAVTVTVRGMDNSIDLDTSFRGRKSPTLPPSVPGSGSDYYRDADPVLELQLHAVKT